MFILASFTKAPSRRNPNCGKKTTQQQQQKSQTTNACKNVGESPNCHMAEKIQTEEYLLYESINVTFSYSMVLEVNFCGNDTNWKGHKGTFLG